MSKTIDARGLKCPLPAIRAEKASATLAPGEQFELLATDPMARIDIPHFCAKNGLAAELTEESDCMRFTISRPSG